MQTYYAKTLYDLVKQYIPDGIYIYHCTTNDIEIEFQIINYNDDIVLNTTTTFENNGTIESNGTGSIYPKGYNNGVTCSGGSSGGGSIYFFK